MDWDGVIQRIQIYLDAIQQNSKAKDYYKHKEEIQSESLSGYLEGLKTGSLITNTQATKLKQLAFATGKVPRETILLILNGEDNDTQTNGN